MLSRKQKKLDEEEEFKLIGKSINFNFTYY